jgi:hypothetical protein
VHLTQGHQNRPSCNAFPLQRENDIEKGIMAPLSDDPIASEPALPPTVPEVELPTTGLPEKPPVSNAELQERAEALSRQWEMVPADTTARLS